MLERIICWMSAGACTIRVFYLLYSFFLPGADFITTLLPRPRRLCFHRRQSVSQSISELAVVGGLETWRRRIWGVAGSVIRLITLLQIYCWVWRWKNYFENWSTFWQSYGQQWRGQRPSVFGQNRSQTKKIGLGHAGLEVWCCIVKHGLTLVVIMNLKDRATVPFVVSLFCVCNITTVNSGVFKGGACASPPPPWPDRRDFCNYRVVQKKTHKI